MKYINRKHFFNEDYFENIDSEEKAYWLGFIAADGAINKSSKYNSYRLSINLSEIDKGHLQKFLDAIGASTISIQTIVNNQGFSSKDGTIITRVVINSYKMCQDLAKYNIHPRKSYDLTLPDIEEKYFKDFLRGFFDGDGSYHYHYDKKNKRYRYSFEVVGASKVIMQQIQEYLLTRDIHLHIYQRNDNYRLMSGSRNEMLKIIHFLFDNSTISLDRKLQKINEIKSIAV